MGPTASGKTGLAVRLRKQFPVDIISVDSALVYRDMNIGTARPDAATLAAAPHALIDIRSPAETYSAAEFCEDALREMARITAAGRVPLLVGGTMLYFRALLNGLAALPSGSTEIRTRLDDEAKEVGWPALHERLAEHDAPSAGRIHPNDSQRIQRALEVFELTGRPMSELQQAAADVEFPYRTLKLVLCPASRAELHRRIGLRFDQMLDAGLVEEVKLLKTHYDLNAQLPSMRSVGYRQVWEMLEHGGEEQESKVREMKEKALAATRQLAKRQLTWLRQETQAMWYDLESCEAEQSIVRKVGLFLEKE
jgi:tRNA dimethylallyltransferase